MLSEFMELFRHKVNSSNIVENYLQILSIFHIKSHFPLVNLFSLPTQNSILVFAIPHAQPKCTPLQGTFSK